MFKSSLVRLAVMSVCFIAAFDTHSAPRPAAPLKLTLKEAILLAVRSNPNVQQSQLSLVSQKFNLYVQQWEFSPHYAFEVSATRTRNSMPMVPVMTTQGWNVQPSVSLLTPIGTQMELVSNNQNNGNFNPGLSLQVMQPLMRGFGKAVVQAALNNAKDSEIISRLNVEGVLRSTVSAVVNAYLDVVAAERTITIDQQAVARATEAVKQTKLFIKAGHKAGNELVTVQANAASAKTQLENDKNSLLQAKYGLLTAIGLDPNTEVSIASLDIDDLLKQYQLPGIEKTKELVLEQDIQYQTDQITLHGPTKRALLVAEDNTRWQLNVTATASTGNNTGGGEYSGFNNMLNGANQSQGIALVLNIPINDQQSKQAVLNAKIGLKQAELALMQEKWSKQTSAINSWNSVVSAQHALGFAEDSEKWQEKTYNVSYQKYLHGLIDSLELQTAQTQLIQSQQVLLNARINYLKSLVNVDYLTGHTLKTWKVQVRL